MKTLLLILSLLLVTTNAYAEWIKYGETATSEYFYKDDSIQFHNELMKVWLKINFKKPQNPVYGRKELTFEMPTKSWDSYDEMNCKTYESRNLFFTLWTEHDLKGDVNYHSKIPTPMKPTPKNTDAMILFNLLCNKKNQ